jgi:hypothetical protein
MGTKALGPHFFWVPRRHLEQHSFTVSVYEHEPVSAVALCIPTLRFELSNESRQCNRGALLRFYTPCFDDVPLKIERNQKTVIGLLQKSAVSVASHSATIALMPCAYPRDNSYSSAAS